jgi:FkbM family methyltransferase
MKRVTILRIPAYLPDWLYGALLRVKHKVASVPRPIRMPWGWFLAWKDHVSERVVRQHDFEVAEQEFVRRFLRPGMTVLDVGAHNGLYSVQASKAIGKSGRVIAFEPSPRERGRLKWNLRVNFCGNVRIEPCAVGSREGTAELFVTLNDSTGCNSLRPPHEEAGPTRPLTVPLTTLDAYLARNGVGRVDFVKLDIEGGELEVLKGAEALFSRRPRPVVMAEIATKRTQQWGYRSVEICTFLAERGYGWFSIGPGGDLSPCPPQDCYDDNLVAVPEEGSDRVADLIRRPSDKAAG